MNYNPQILSAILRKARLTSGVEVTYLRNV